MSIETRKPTEQLAPFVRNYLIIESGTGLVNKVLPDTSIVMAFRFKGSVNFVSEDNCDTLPVSAISGLRKTARIINYSKDAGTVLVIFKEAGAKAFLKEQLHELFGRSESLDNFINHQKLLFIEEQLAEAATNDQRIAIIERFLQTELMDYQPDKLVYTAMQKIRISGGIVKINELAGSLYISQDAFEKRFRKIAGASPKQFSSIVRMRSIIQRNQYVKNLTEMAYDGGYFDQPHFVKDFRLFTGQTPTDFFKAPSFW